MRTHHRTIHFNSYIMIVKDEIKLLCRRLGGIKCGDGCQIPEPLVSKIITNDGITEGVYPWVQHKTNPLPLLRAGCICREIQGDMIDNE